MLGIVSNRIREFNGDIDSLQRMGLTILVGDFYQVIQFWLIWLGQIKFRLLTFDVLDTTG